MQSAFGMSYEVWEYVLSPLLRPGSLYHMDIVPSSLKNAVTSFFSVDPFSSPESYVGQLLLSYFLDEETKVSSDKVTCSKLWLS